jgi:hypothetical protein
MISLSKILDEKYKNHEVTPSNPIGLPRWNFITATNRSAAQPNVVKENSADRHPIVQLTSPKAGTLEVIRRVQIKLDLI